MGNGTICYEVFPGDKTTVRDYERLISFGFQEKSNQYGQLFYIEVNKCQKSKVDRLIRKMGVKSRFYAKKWERSGNYRREFFDAHHAPFWCAYCGRRLKGNQVQVDHLIPVRKAKTSRKAQWFLQIRGINNVNNVRNLVAACERCNLKKSDKMGFWVIRGILGRHSAC